jgi:hypothetical protein
MRYINSRLLLAAIFFLPNAVNGIDKEEQSKQDTIKYISPYAKENERCFKCHSLKKYEYTDKVTGKALKGVMDPEGILDRNDFYSSNHKSFICTDCHSSQFQDFPHSEELRNEQQFNCLDCHGGDPDYAVFKFEEIDAEFRKSIHFRLEEKGFNCWQCHDPHSYRLTARHNPDIKETVKYDNAICLNCHADYERFRLFSDRPENKLSKVHKWLPHQSTHFKSVRCIDCHTKANENILVPHYVMPEEAALRDCRKCHTGDAKEMASLLLIKTDNRNNQDFTNNAVINSLSIIGPNRNNYLNRLILTFFTAVIAVIGVHIFFRVIRK